MKSLRRIAALAAGAGLLMLVLEGASAEEPKRPAVEDRPRVRIKVTPEGYGAIEFLDAEGKVVQTIAPEADRKRPGA